MTSVENTGYNSDLNDRTGAYKVNTIPWGDIFPYCMYVRSHIHVCVGGHWCTRKPVSICSNQRLAPKPFSAALYLFGFGEDRVSH